MKHTLLTLTALLLAPLAALHAANAPKPIARPNLVIILADDLGYGDVGCYGSWIQTPNLDQLAREGTKFTDFHANGPVCSPTRCALVTGRYQQRAGIGGIVNWAGDGGLKKSEFTFADALKPVGYATAVFGKWHLGGKPECNPVSHGFDEFRGLLGGRFDYFTHTDSEGPDWWDGLKPVVEKGYSTTLITDHAVDFIQRSKSKPFCLYVAFNAVHTPIQDPETGTNGKTADIFGKMVQAMDKGVGRVIAALKENGLAENTFVFFFSDNGGHEGIEGSSNQPLRGFKGSFWEGGHREPGIAWWPGHIPAGKVTGQTAMSMDLMPTLLELAGAKLPLDRKLDGVSLAALLLHDQPLAPRKLFWNKGADSAMRDGPWKLLIEKGAVHLFNLDNDLSEKNDLATQQPERVQTMRADIDAWAKEVGARDRTAPKAARDKSAPDSTISQDRTAKIQNGDKP
jgi:arylsulfatase A-like enzyme